MKNVMLNEKQYDLFKRLMLEDMEYGDGYEDDYEEKPDAKIMEYANELERRNTFSITDQGSDYVRMASEEISFEIRMDNDDMFGGEPKPCLANIRIPMGHNSEYALEQVKSEINFLIEFFKERNYG